MADNVTIPLTGSGDATAIVATDEVGGAQHQYVKLEFGADGTATKVSSSDPLPVTFALGASAAHQVTGNASLSSILVSLGDILTELSQKMEAGDAVTVSSSALPTGAATSAKQDTVIGHLDGVEGLLGTIDADTGSIASSVAPVSSANNQGSTVSIPTSNTQALAAFSTRKGGTIYAPLTNSQIVYISLGGTATSSGIPLGVGDSMPLNQGSGAYAGAVNALSASGTQSLIVVEW